MHYLSSILTLLTFVARTYGAEPVVSVRAERDLYGFAAQQALSFEPARVTMSRNSNFVCPAGPVAELGLFHSAYSKSWKLSRQELEQIQLRIPPKLNAPQLQPHATRYYLGSQEVTTRRPAESAVERTLAWTCDSAQWTAEKAIRAEIRAAKDAAPELRLTELKGSSAKPGPWRTVETACKSIDGAWECELPGFGKARLRLP